MITKAVTLSNGATQVLTTGRYRVKRIDLSYTAAATADFYDSYSSTHTQSNGAYTDGTNTEPTSRTGATVLDIVGNTVAYTYTGAYHAQATVAADASSALPKLATIALPGAGTLGYDINMIITEGLSVQCTAAATLNIEYETIP